MQRTSKFFFYVRQKGDLQSKIKNSYNKIKLVFLFAQPFDWEISNPQNSYPFQLFSSPEEETERLACVSSPVLPAKTQRSDFSISQWTDGLLETGGRKHKLPLVYSSKKSECRGLRNINGQEEPFGKMSLDAMWIMQ